MLIDKPDKLLLTLSNKALIHLVPCKLLVLHISLLQITIYEKSLNERNTLCFAKGLLFKFKTKI